LLTDDNIARKVRAVPSGRRVSPSSDSDTVGGSSMSAIVTVRLTGSPSIAFVAESSVTVKASVSSSSRVSTTRSTVNDAISFPASIASMPPTTV